ncbi:MAG: nuclear transport factor 2 family protein, partial [Cytophagales bacterium]
MKSIAIIFMAFASHFSLYAQDDFKVDLLSRKKFTWLTQKKLDSLADMPDERLMYVHSNGWMQTKKEMIDDLKSGKLNYISVDVKSNKVRVYNNTA